MDLGEAASFQLWMNVINLSPFEVELDRAEFEFSYAGSAEGNRAAKAEIRTGRDRDLPDIEAHFRRASEPDRAEQEGELA